MTINKSATYSEIATKLKF